MTGATERLNARARCPFQIVTGHQLTWIGVRFGRTVTEYIRCEDCGPWELEEGVWAKALLARSGEIIVRQEKER